LPTDSLAQPFAELAVWQLREAMLEMFSAGGVAHARLTERLVECFGEIASEKTLRNLGS
jgi:hypothetical protein